MRATATERRRFMPPENEPATWFDDADSRTCSIRRSASATTASAAMPLIVPKSTRCSLAVRLSHRMSNCGHTPMKRLIWFMPDECATVWPRTSALPCDGGRKPVSMLMVVVLPAPLGPRSANSCRLPTAYQGSLTAWKAFPPRLNVCRSPRISIPLASSKGLFAICVINFSSSITSSSVDASMTSTLSTTLAVPNPQYEGVAKYQGALRTPIASGRTFST
mmetsp:Transcript_34582/g.78854  ORF Transcript_34582/g.78854 Transcript_34582/m.78854 type:complete len:220 (-) Transcript_34582:1806-2465(-)